MATLQSILARLEKIERKLNIDRTVGQWVRGWNGEVIWDPWDPDDISEEEARATRESLRRQIELTAERMRADPNYKPPTPEQLEAGRRAFEACIERFRAERQAIRDFSDAYERERAGRVA